jgi:hypothetical protein
VSAEKLAESMTVRYNKIRNEVFRVPLKPEEAADVRDAIAKALYGRQFNWLVERINRSISKSASTNARSFIGVLDIFGFENFTVHSFLIGLRISIETRVLTSRASRVGCVCNDTSLGQQLRAVVHQLRQREAATTVQPAHLQAGAGGVRTRKVRFSPP